MNLAFSKIWVFLIFIVILTGGILAWQYLRIEKEEAKIPEEIRLPKEKITEKKIKIGGKERRIKEKKGKWNTLIIEEEKKSSETYLGYEVDYSKDWEIYAEPGLVFGFVNSFKKNLIELVCDISITPIARNSYQWEKPCAETQPSYYSRYYPKWEIERSSIRIGNTQALKLTNLELPANIMYSFGPNLYTPDNKWCFEVGLNIQGYTTNEKGNKMPIEFGKSVVPECNKILNQILSTFKFKEREAPQPKQAIQLMDKALLKIEEIKVKQTKSDKDIERIQKLIGEAISAARKAIKLDPANSKLWFQRGNIYWEIRDVATGAKNWALKCYKRALELDPDNQLYQQKISELIGISKEKLEP